MEKSGILYLTEIFILMGVIIALIFTILLFIQVIGVNYEFLKFVSQNWKYGPVVNIFQSSICTVSDTQSLLLSDHWQGTHYGCLRNSGSLINHGCGKKGGTSIDAIEPIPYKIWRNTSLCAERFSGSYLDLKLSRKDSECPNDHRSCGIIDTLNNLLCIPKTKSCPINYFEISSNPSVDPTHSSIPLSNANLIFSNKRITGNILNSFFLSEDTPCADPAYKNYIAPIFVLENYYERAFCKISYVNMTTDNKVELKDQYSFYNIYQENGILDAMSSLPTFSNYSEILKNSNRRLGLYHKKYFGLKIYCLNLIQEKNISSTLINEFDHLNDLIGNSDSTVLVALIIIAVGCLFSITSVITANVCDFCCDNPFSVPDYKTRYFFALIPVSTAIANLVIVSIIFSDFNSIGNTFYLLYGNQCGEDITNQAIDIAYSVSNYGYKYALCSLIGSIIPIIAYLLNGLIIFKYKS